MDENGKKNIAEEKIENTEENIRLKTNAASYSGKEGHKEHQSQEELQDPSEILIIKDKANQLRKLKKEIKALKNKIKEKHRHQVIAQKALNKIHHKKHSLAKKSAVEQAFDEVSKSYQALVKKHDGLKEDYDVLKNEIERLKQ